MRSVALSSTIRCLLAAATVTSIAAPAFADTAASGRLDDIVVTATRRETSLQDVPLAITALTGDALDSAGVTRLEDLATEVPNTFINTGSGLRTTSVTVRGISSNPNNPGVDPSIGVFVDGVYMSRPTTLNANLYDLERVEVVRGPQGALYGKNTIAGALNFITRAPSETAGGEFDLGYGNYGALNAFGAVTGPLGTPDLLGRASVSVQKRDGLVTNLATGTKLDDVDAKSARISLLWKASEAVTVQLRADKSRDRTHDGSADVLDNGAFTGSPLADASPWDRRVSNNLDPVQNRDVSGVSLQVDARFAAGTLTSLTSSRRFTWYNLADNDFTVLDMLSSGIAEDQAEWSQELRFVSKPNGPLNYIVGAYVSHQRLDTVSTAIVGPDLGIYPQDVTGIIDANVKTDTTAAYGQLSYDFDAHWNGSLTARVSDEKKSVDQSQTGDPFQILLQTQPLQHLTRKDSEFSPSGSLSYKFSKDVTGYGSISRGFKAGGFNVFSISMTDPARYSPETVTSYELGVKSVLADGRVRLNTALYYLDYRDLQVNQLVLVSGIPQFTTSNAASASSKGAEVELEARLTPELEATFSYGYTDATYKSFPNATSAGDDYSGHRLPDAAKQTGGAALAYTKPLTAGLDLSARVDFTYRSGVFFQPDNAGALSQGGYGLVGARIGFGSHDHRWGVTAWGRNLTDRQYALTRQNGPIVPGQVIQSLGLPRMYGIDVRFAF